MKRILITEDIKALAKAFAREMEDVKTFGENNSPKEKLFALSKALGLSSTIIKVLKHNASKGHPAVYTYHKGSDMTCLSKYVKAIHDNYNGLNCLLPSEWDEKIAQKVDSLLIGYNISELKVKLPKKPLMPFYELVVEAMRYDRVQKYIIPKYIRRLGIKTCVYCNAQYAVTASMQKNKYDSKGNLVVVNIDYSCYELDHNKAKSIYPYLCTNFYNLQPSCGSCNRRKNNRNVDLSLYYEDCDIETNSVHFALNPADIIKFRTNNKCDSIRPHLCNEGTDYPPENSDNKSKAGILNKIFGVQNIYDEHVDIVEELLWKHKIYSKGFMDAMIAQIKSLGLDNFDIKRFIIGVYSGREDDFFKRPLSIMKSDLWEQLERTIKC